MVYIDPNKPLPSHTKLNYDECFAKLVLEKFLPDIFSNLRISDTPDLRDDIHSVGIEVTSAVSREDQEALHIASWIPYEDEKKKAYHYDRLQKMNYQYKQYGLSHPYRSWLYLDLANPLIEKTACCQLLVAFKNKVQKLNSKNYADLQCYHLYVYSELFIADWMPPQLLEKLCSLNNDARKYTNVYLLALEGLFIFNLKQKQYRFIEKGTKLWGLGELARRMVEEGEANDES